MIHVLAIITAKPGQRSALLQDFKAIVPTVHAEVGCIEYGPVVDVDGADPAFGLTPLSWSRSGRASPRSTRIR
jgi:quinol monooxygenase YgiN